ncbi:MAG TPA: HAMP domain-containing sensor histidine kinase [Polyangiaceae bacterium]|nr:HAMP domain-containing sensor histidine kinase [Polyangiaceae bacterium]
MASTAGAAALVAALTTSSLAVGLLREAEDRRLNEAARDLGYLIERGTLSVNAAVEYESSETAHSGIGFAVWDSQHRRIAGDHFDAPRPDLGCWNGPGGLRGCTVRTKYGQWVVAAAPRVSSWASFGWAVLVSVLGTTVLGWWASRKLALVAIRPLDRLSRELNELDWERHSPVTLALDGGVLEVEQLRSALVHSLARARDAIELAERFAANAAHELRTPLTSIRAEVELLLERAPAGTERELERLHHEVTGLVRLVEKLLILSTPLGSAGLDPTGRAGAGLAMQGSPISLRDIVDDALGLLAPSERARVDTCDGDAVVRGDEVLLGALAANALGNALKFGERARVELREGGGRATLLVLDDGPGVPASERERLFEPFVRGNRVPRGQGLGLALIRHVAELHRGNARFVDPPQGHGAALEIALPLATASNPPSTTGPEAPKLNET